MGSNSSTKARLEANFWSLVERRHPMTRWWWTGDPDPPAMVWPDWSKASFLREAEEWRRLAKDTVEWDDEEIGHWGQFARHTANRILAGSYADGAEPLRYANLVLTIIRLLDPQAGFVERDALLEGLITWLDGVQDVVAVGFWRKTRVEGEAARLKSQVNGLQVPEALRKRGTTAVNAYVERIQVGDEQEPIPWAVSAHVSVDDWRDRRVAMTRETPMLVAKPIPTARLLARNQINAPVLQEVVVPGLHEWWLRPGPNEDILYHGDAYNPSIALGALLALWRQQNRCQRLTWALSLPPLVEGGLMTVADLVGTVWSDWLPVKERYIAQWLQRRRAMAVADAWLWLEAGDPHSVREWMSRFMPKTEATAVVPWMKAHPGYYVMAHRVFEVLAETGPSHDWTHWLFSHGPRVPSTAFLAP